MASPSAGSEAVRLQGRLFEKSAHGFVAGTRDGSSWRANAAARHILGLSGSAVAARELGGILVDHPAAREFLAARRRDGIARGLLQLRRRDGSVVPADVTSWISPAPGGEEVVCIAFQAAPEPEPARDASEEARHKLKAIFESSHDAILVADDEARYLDVNPSACVLLGRRREEIVGRTVYDMTPADQQEAARELWRQFVADGRQAFDYELERPDGTRASVEYRAQAHILPGVHMSVLHDVTDRKRAEKALRDSEERFRALAEHAPVGIFIADPVGDNVYVNPVLQQQMGQSGPEVLGAGWTKAMHPSDRERVRREWDEAAAAGADFRSEHRFVQPSGELVTVKSYGAPMRDASGGLLGFVGVVVDVTKERVAEQQLAVASRLAALGTLVAGVGHEINNPLGAAMANDVAAMAALDEFEARTSRSGSAGSDAASDLVAEVRQLLEGALSANQRIAQIVKELVALGRTDARRDRVRLRSVVDATIRWLPLGLGRPGVIELEDRGAPDVVGQAGQLTQVVLNLIANASKAGRDGKPPRMVVRIGPGSPGMARLEVSDEGVGMAPEVMKRIFDPFYTTRQVGQGTGLGLSICHAIVTEHGGTIGVSSDPGKGSTFTVELPAAPGA